MKIVVGYVMTAEGEAALERSIEETRLRGGHLVVVHSMRGEEEAETVLAYRQGLEDVKRRLEQLNVPHTIHEYVRGQSPSEDVVQVATDEDAELIVIGLRRRSAVGKVLLGSTFQDILYHAKCPVLAVKADYHLYPQESDETHREAP